MILKRGECGFLLPAMLNVRKQHPDILGRDFPWNGIAPAISRPVQLRSLQVMPKRPATRFLSRPSRRRGRRTRNRGMHVTLINLIGFS
jgi:hypothetical protein